MCLLITSVPALLTGAGTAWPLLTSASRRDRKYCDAHDAIGHVSPALSLSLSLYLSFSFSFIGYWETTRQKASAQIRSLSLTCFGLGPQADPVACASPRCPIHHIEAWAWLYNNLRCSKEDVLVPPVLQTTPERPNLSLSLPSFLPSFQRGQVLANGPAPRRASLSYVHEKRGFGVPQSDFHSFGLVRAGASVS